MKKDIVNFIQLMKEKHGFTAIYLPNKDLYCLRYKGRGIQNFDSKVFYQLPKAAREHKLLAIKKVGLNHNAGEKNYKEKLYQTNMGKRI
jgi:hypothetical protein